MSIDQLNIKIRKSLKGHNAKVMTDFRRLSRYQTNSIFALGAVPGLVQRQAPHGDQLTGRQAHSLGGSATLCEFVKVFTCTLQDAFTTNKEHALTLPTTWVMGCAYSPSGR